MGDFNAKIGKLTTSSANNAAVGPHALDELNENGKRVIELAYASELRVANTYFKKKFKRKWTWI